MQTMMLDPDRLPADAVEAACQVARDLGVGVLGHDAPRVIAAFLSTLLADHDAMKRATRAGWPGLIDGPSNALTIHCARVRAALVAAVQTPQPSN